MNYQKKYLSLKNSIQYTGVNLASPTPNPVSQTQSNQPVPPTQTLPLPTQTPLEGILEFAKNKFNELKEEKKGKYCWRSY
jgi:hypothetical protein